LKASGLLINRRADIFSLDLFYSGFGGDMLDPVRGRKFRYGVLQPGGSSSEWETMTEYLGREPNTKAFYRELGWDV
jgi:metallopeptidase MepB